MRSLPRVALLVIAGSAVALWLVKERAETSIPLDIERAIRSLRLEPHADAREVQASAEGFRYAAGGFEIRFDRGEPAVLAQPNQGPAMRMRAVGRFEPASARDGAVCYASADAQSALLYRPARFGVKEDLILLNRKSFGAGLFQWMLELPSQLDARMAEDGGIEFHDRCRKPGVTLRAARIPPPVARDAAGGALPARFEWTRPYLNVRVGLPDAAVFPVTVDPTLVLPSDSDFPIDGNDEGLIRYETNEIHRDGVRGWQIPSWLPAGSFATGRSGHGCAVYNGFLTVVGGDFLSDVQKAPINPDGSVGAFTATTAVPGEPRSGAGVVAHNGFLYVIGGENASGVVLADVRYARLNDDGTISPGAWQMGAPLPGGGRSQFVCAAVDNHVYVVSGIGLGGATTDVLKSTIRPDGSLGGWSLMSSTTAFRRNAGGFVHDGHIYAMGGNNGSFELDSVEYARIKPDGALSAWMATRALPRAREGARAACVNGYAFVVGGKQTPTSVIAAPVLAGGGLGPWIGTASLSEGRASAAAVGYNGRVFVVGGSGSNSVVSGLPEGGHVGGWSTLSSLPTGRALHGAATYGGVVTVTGGTDLSIAGLTSVQYSAIGADGALGAWSDTTPLPGARYYHATVAYDSFLYAVGGETGVGAAQTFYKTVYVASMSATGSLGAWSSAEDLPLNRSRMGVHVYNGRMYAVGGVVNVGLLTQITNTVVAANVDPSGGGVTGWAAATSLPEARSRHASVLYAGRLYVIGGEGVAGSLNDVRFAQIKADGSLSAWSAPMPLPQSVVDGSAIAMHGTLYVYSGSAMLSAPINQDGTLGAFTSTAPPPTSRSGARMVAHSGVVYVTGGTSGGAVESDMSVVEGGGVTTHGTVSGWTTTTQMPATLASHAAAAYDGYVYVTGGFSGGFLNDVRYAPVNPDGTIGAWTATNSFAGPRAGHACVAHRGYLYVIGGRDGGGDLTDVQKAPIQPDGSVGTWEVLSSLIIERHDHAVAVYGEFLYAIGGTTALDEVEFASINPDGTLGAWSGTTALPTGRWDHASVAYNGYLYALGGSDGADRLREAQVAPINVDGTLGPWQPTTGLPLAREAHAAVVENGYVYVLGGSRAAGDTSNAVLSAPIHGDGSLGEWTFTQPLAQKRSAHAAVVHAGCAYVLGGKTGLVPATDTVQFARLRTPNARGVYSRRIDLGATLNVVSLLTMGGGSNGQARVAVRLAPEGSDWGDASVIDPLPWGTPVTLSGVGRYLHLRYTLDDTSAVVVNADAPAHLAVGGITIESDSAPGVPASAEQFQSDGLTAIPVGGGASTATVVFKATLSDADPGDVIRLHVEVQPVGVPFTDSPTASSGFVPSGTLASVPVGGLTPGWEYHWQCWAEDSAGVVSTFFDYGGNSVDFFIDRPPDVPGAMGQFESDGVTPIPDGGTSGSSTVVFEAVLADPDSGSQVKLQLELKPQGVPFTDTASFESALGAPGTSVGITVSGLALGGYHWQMCCVDDLGLASAWTPFSGADPNFIVGSANGAPGAPGVPAQLQSDGATLIPLGGQAATSVVIVRGDATDPDGGDVVKLQVELRPTDTGFSSPASPIIDGVAFFESSLGAQGTHFVSLAIPGDGSYHWQARAVDGAGAASAWTPYGNNGDTPPAGIDFVLDLINDPPAIDGSTVGQFLPDGVTPIAVGGGAANGGVLFRATVVDPNGDTVKLQVELRDTSTPLVPAFTHESGFVSSGSVISIASGALADGDYHWAYRAVDAIGNVGTWTSFGGNPEASADFFVAASGTPSVDALEQFTANGVTPLPLGSSTSSDTVVLSAIMSDPEGGKVKLQVEMQPVGVPFTDAFTHESGVVVSGGVAQIVVSGLADGAYHWQARAVDMLAVASVWTSFGGNDEVDPDFRVDVTDDPPSAPFALGQYVPPGTAGLCVGGDPFGRTVLLRAMATDPEAGQVRFEFEVRPVGVPFGDIANAPAATRAPGVFATVVLDDLAVGAYHWQVRASDDSAQASSWVGYGANSEDSPDFTITATTAIPPNAPMSLQQRTTNDLAEIAVGGVLDQAAVRLKAMVVHPRTEIVKLQVEVRPIDASITGTPTGESAFVESGSTVDILQFGLPNGGFHWAARTVDSKGTTSPWVAFGANAEDAADFSIDVPYNSPPNEPAFVGQLRADGVTQISLGGTSTQAAIQSYAFLSDPDGDTVRLEVEIKPVGESFDGALSGASDFTFNGSTVRLDMGSIPDGRHHWRARVVDAFGSASQWVPYGGNAESEADFIVNSAANGAPNLAAFLEQRRDGTVSLEAGAFAGPGEVTFVSDAPDPVDENDLVRLEVEVRPVSESLVSTPTHSGPLMPEGYVAEAVVDRFTIGQAYHWRARLVDLNGQSAGWVDFGGNGAGQADFVSSFTIAGGSSGKCGALGADVLIPLALVWFWRRRRARVSTKAVSFRTANPASAARPGPGSG